MVSVSPVIPSVHFVGSLSLVPSLLGEAGPSVVAVDTDVPVHPVTPLPFLVGVRVPLFGVGRVYLRLTRSGVGVVPFLVPTLSCPPTNVAAGVSGAL